MLQIDVNTCVTARKLTRFCRTIAEGWENLKESMAFLLIFSVLKRNRTALACEFFSNTMGVCMNCLF